MVDTRTQTNEEEVVRVDMDNTDDDNENDACHECGRAAILACSECKTAVYCSNKCADAAWVDHAEECGEMAVGEIRFFNAIAVNLNRPQRMDVTTLVEFVQSDKWTVNPPGYKLKELARDLSIRLEPTNNKNITKKDRYDFIQLIDDNIMKYKTRVTDKGSLEVLNGLVSTIAKILKNGTGTRLAYPKIYLRYTNSFPFRG